MSLEALTARVRDDLARIAHPSLPWMEPVVGPDGAPVLDVLIVGGGQSGLAIAFGLKRAQINNILVVDRAPSGLEGPWLTYARMHTLRSPKDYTGPDLDVPSLTYRSWHEASYGSTHWQALDQIRRQDWAAYLAWFRDATCIDVCNDAEVVDIAPVPPLPLPLSGDRARAMPKQCLAVTFADATVRYARKVVLATGQDGGGVWWMPDFVAALPTEFRACAADAIDFGLLKGRRVAVLGAGASALDNAAMALEAAAREVTVFCRRAEPQVVQPFRWLTFAGFLRHLSDLDDAWRWRFMSHILGLREGFPQATWDRCVKHPAFSLRTGAPWLDARMIGDTVAIDTPQFRHEADFLICGTGMAIDFGRRPELRRVAHNIVRWRDRYTPPLEERNDRLAEFPYLASDFSLQPRVPGATDWMRDVHMFNIASTMSFGPSGASINAMTTAVPKLVWGLTEGLFKSDVDRHWAALRAYDTKQAVLGPMAAGSTA